MCGHVRTGLFRAVTTTGFGVVIRMIIFHYLGDLNWNIFVFGVLRMRSLGKLPPSLLHLSIKRQMHKCKNR